MSDFFMSKCKHDKAEVINKMSFLVLELLAFNWSKAIKEFCHFSAGQMV